MLRTVCRPYILLNFLIEQVSYTALEPQRVRLIIGPALSFGFDRFDLLSRPHMWNETEIKLKHNFSRRSTKLFCFSSISAARTCETECWNKFKMGVASVAGIAVGLSRPVPTGYHFACLPSCVHIYRMFANTRLDFFVLIGMSWAGIRGRVRHNALRVVISHMQRG